MFGREFEKPTRMQSSDDVFKEGRDREIEMGERWQLQPSQVVK